MITDVSSRIENSIVLNKDSVWVLSNRAPFTYSDGSERYLEKVFSHAKDLSSDSYELEQWIKDWPSEYHLSRKRAQLLRGFDFDRSKRVLEVGCGCGAITRFLGETFDDVMSIEGSLARARIARLRTKNMKNVTILCAPFQEIKFKERFDMIFCIGVLEYSGTFVKADDPYDAILNCFDKLLKPDGLLILAIENQFGLKYFSSYKEDHTNIMFDGIEGYPHFGNKNRTFGYDELNFRLSKYFSNIDFYFPYPDYKMPSCVLSEKFLNKVKAGELVGNYHHSGYFPGAMPLFDENLAYLELDKNNKLPFFSNSFLAVAGRQKPNSLKTQCLGILYTTYRAKEFQTFTRFVEHNDKSIWAHKIPINEHKNNMSFGLMWHPTACKWESGTSLSGIITQRVKRKNMAIEELFDPCKIWIKKVKALSTIENNKMVIDGKYIDCTWRNCFIHGEECVFIDQEWEWREKISINVLLIRCLYSLLDDISSMKEINSMLGVNSKRSLIKEIARSLGVVLVKEDFREFCMIESKLYQIVYGGDFIRTWFSINFALRNKAIHSLFSFSMRCLEKLIRKFK